jgi:hypothetical protein
MRRIEYRFHPKSLNGISLLTQQRYRIVEDFSDASKRSKRAFYDVEEALDQ